MQQNGWNSKQWKISSAGENVEQLKFFCITESISGNNHSAKLNTQFSCKLKQIYAHSLELRSYNPWHTINWNVYYIIYIIIT